ncbi:MAG: porin PorA family protein [Anaerolineales bacterium]
MSRQTSWLLIGIGGVLIVGALALAFVVVPTLAIFPDDAESERILELDYLTLFRPEEMKFFRAEPGATDDVRFERQVRVEAVDGDAMLIREDQQIINAGDPLIELVYHYALDRRDLRQAENIPNEWRDFPGFWDRDGFVIQWEIGTQPQDYDGWVEDFRQTRPLEFIREETRAGMETYYFEARNDPAPMDPARDRTTRAESVSCAHQPGHRSHPRHPRRRTPNGSADLRA